VTHLFNFKARFAPAVERGLRGLTGGKRQTMRPRRKRPVKTGDTLRLYCGLRTKATVFLGEAPCKKVQGYWLHQSYYLTAGRPHSGGSREAHALAHADGFADYDEMFSFFEKTYRGTRHFKRGRVRLELVQW